MVATFPESMDVLERRRLERSPMEIAAKAESWPVPRHRGHGAISGSRSSGLLPNTIDKSVFGACFLEFSLLPFQIRYHPLTNSPYTMSPTGRQNVNQYHQQHRQQSRIPDTAPYPSASQRHKRHSNSPSTSSMASSRTRRESSISQQSDTRGSDDSPTHEGRRANEADIEGQTQSIDLVGQPIRFTTGQFAGCTIRMVLQEIQKADLGRKYVHSLYILFQSQRKSSSQPFGRGLMFFYAITVSFR